MDETISSRAYSLLYATILALILSVIATAQITERVINWHPRVVQGPLKASGCGFLVPAETPALDVVEVKVAGKPVALGQSFTAHEDWLRTLSVKVRNISGKPISSINMRFNLPEAVYQESTMSFTLGYRDVLSDTGIHDKSQKVILPGEEVVLTRSDVHYDRDNRDIAQRTGKADFSQALIGLTSVRFDDGTSWSGGKLPLYNQNLNAGTRVAFKPGGHRVSGTLTLKPDSFRIERAVVEITRINSQAIGAGPFKDCTYTDSLGRWSINDVPDGEYVVLVRYDDRIKDANSQAIKFVGKSFPIKIAGGDIEDLTVEVNPGGRIKCTVVMESGQALPKDLIIAVDQTSITDRSPGRVWLVQPDGSFILEGVPTGDVLLKAIVPGGKPAEYQMKSLTVKGADSLGKPLSVKDGVEVKDVRIVFAKSTEN